MLPFTVRLLLAALVASTFTCAQQPVVTTFPMRPLFVVDGERMHAFVVATGTATHQVSLDAGRTWSLPTPAPALQGVSAQPYGLGWVADGDFLAGFASTANGPTLVRSFDGGLTWAPPIFVSPQATPVQGGGVFCGQGVVAVVWAERSTANGEVFVSRSLDFGTTWSNPVRLDQPTLGIGTNGVPTVGGNARALYASWSVGSNFDGQLQVSTDLGASWLPAARPLPLGSFSSLCFAAEGAVVLAQCGPTIHRSADSGATWTAVSPPMFVTGSTRLAIDGNYVLGAYSRQGTYFPYSYEVRSISSSDSGLTWSPPSANLIVNPGYAPLSLSIALRGQQAALGVNYVWTSFFYFRFGCLVSGDLGQTWTNQPTPQGAAAQTGSVFSVQDGFYAAYTDYVTYSGTLLCGSQPYGPATPGTGSFAPHLASTGTPCLGTSVVFTIENGLGGAPALLAATLAGPDQRTFGSATILVHDPVVPVWSFTSGASGTPGVGRTTMTLAIPNAPPLAGLRMNLQGFVLDVGAANGFSATGGLEMWVQ